VTYKPLPSVLSQEQKQLLKSRIEDTIPLSGHHPVLGWSPKPHMHTDKVRINSQGIRAEHDYSHAVDPRVIRVSAFGDSFTFGSEVDNEETWERQLEGLDSHFEVLNFGMGAYGLDQAYLRYLQDGVPFNSDIVVIGFMSENIYRNLNVFRPFYYSSYSTNIYTKPRFSLENGTLSLLKNPLTTIDDYTRFITHDEEVLQEIGHNDYFYWIKYRAGRMDRLPSVRLIKIATQNVKERLNPVVTLEGSYAVSSEGFRLTTRLFEEFSCAALRHGSLPVIVIYPDLGDLRRQRNHQPRRYKPLLEHLHTKGFRYLDVLDDFVEHEPTLSVDRLTVGKWGHYSPLGNALVATHLQHYLNNEKLTVRDNIQAFVREACPSENCCPTLTPRD
jgi:hypothetical protein